MTNLLSFRRLGRLFAKDFVEGYRTLLIAVGAVTGVLLLNYIVGAISGGGNELVQSGGFYPGRGANSTTHMVFFSLTLIIGGFIITSRAFSELHTKNRNHDWLMLPASPLEKYLTRLVLTSIGVGVGTVVYFFLFSLLAAGLSLLLIGRSYPLFNPVDGTVWMLVLHYVVLQSLFFAGAVYFKRAHLIKTVLALTAFGFVLLLLAAGVARLAFWQEFRQLTAGNGLQNLDWAQFEPKFRAAGETLSLIFRIAYWALLAPIMWIFAYLRLRESEVRNGV